MNSSSSVASCLQPRYRHDSRIPLRLTPTRCSIQNCLSFSSSPSHSSICSSAIWNHQDRLLYTMQYFHGDKESAKLYLRSMALVWNFHPYRARTLSGCRERMSPFTDLNGFRYHDNWLHNLLIASSMNGRQTLQSG